MNKHLERDRDKYIYIYMYMQIYDQRYVLYIAYAIYIYIYIMICGNRNNIYDNNHVVHVVHVAHMTGAHSGEHCARPCWALLESIARAPLCFEGLSKCFQKKTLRKALGRALRTALRLIPARDTNQYERRLSIYIYMHK